MHHIRGSTLIALIIATHALISLGCALPSGGGTRTFHTQTRFQPRRVLS